MRAPARVLSALLALGVALAGCSFGGDDDEAASQAADESEDAGGEAPGDDDGAGGVEVVATAQAQAGRQVVRTAEITLTVDDVGEAAAAAVDLAEDAGGFQASAQLSLAAEAPTGSVVLRVPSAAFDDVLAAVAGLGEEGDRVVGSEDVTGAVVDLEARIVATTASVERVRGFLDQTGDVVQLAAVERELLTREAELEALDAQLSGLRDRVDLSTITARFGVEAPPPIVADPEPSDDIPGPARALRHGWVVLLNVAKVAAAIVAFALPFAAVAVPVLLVGRRLRRRLAG